MTARIGKTFHINKDGKVTRAKRKTSVSEKIRQRTSKRVRVAKRGTTT